MAEDLTLAEISTDVVSSINTNFSEVEDAVNAKAELNGNNTQRFNVADAVESTEAVNKGQFDSSISEINTAVSELETEIDNELTTKLDVSDTSVTKQGNTFNGANQLVQLDSNCKLPAIDGSLLTGLAGGMLSPLVEKGTVTSNFTLDLNKVNTANITSNIVISLPTSGFISGFENKCILDFTISNTSYLTLPSGILKKDGKALTFSALSGVRNVLTFITRDRGTTWEAELSLYGGVEITFNQPILSTNGTLGGSSFAVYASNRWDNSGNFEAYKAFDGNLSTEYASYYGYYDYILYNPIALKILTFTFVADSGDPRLPATFNLYGSNDNLTYTFIQSGTNSNPYNYSFDILPANQNYYKYYKLSVASSVNGSYGAFRQCSLAATYIAV